MGPREQVKNVLIGATAAVFFGGSYFPEHDRNGPVLEAVVGLVREKSATPIEPARESARDSVASETHRALSAFAATVRSLSHPRALEGAFQSYFAYKSAHFDEVRKPYLYFVDYGLPSTMPRGYVFDMSNRTIVDGPFTVAHGRGSSTNRNGIPTSFSNSPGSAATSLGLYLAQEAYGFHGKMAGRSYGSIGLRLTGLSGDFNDNARARHVVAHGAPYVTAAKAGRSEGCPAMEPSRARRLLPLLADGGMVFLFAPSDDWMIRDPWLAGSKVATDSSLVIGQRG